MNRAHNRVPFKISLVVPVFNEVETIDHFLNEIFRTFDSVFNSNLEIIFVNDGSIDSTLETILKYQKQDARIVAIDLSRNFGKEAALTAGLEAAIGDVIVPIDVDLQDPPELIVNMIERWREGYDVVLARRINRDSDPLIKRISANWFYRIQNKIGHPNLPENVGDFRLMDRQVVEALKTLPESRRFMKGLFAWAGFRTTYLDYVRSQRIAGKTKFNSWKLWNFALEGITSFSTVPLRIWTYIGFFVSMISFLFGLFIFARVILHGIDVPGYASLIVAVTFLGGLQLIGIGIIGEYIGRIYIEAKRRPIYLIRKTYKTGSIEHGPQGE